MQQILSTKQTYTLEELILKEQQLSIEMLMKEAGQAVWYQLINVYGVMPKNMCVFVGSGNNGGDALVLALLALKAGVSVDVVQVCPTKSKYLNNLYDEHEQLTQSLTDKYMHKKYDVIIDGVFGIGYKLREDDNINNWISAFNAMNGFKVAIDIPSGVDANSGFARQHCSVDLTITFFAPKIGHCFNVGKAAQKKLVVALKHYFKPYGYRVVQQNDLPPKALHAHKYECGNVCVIGGSNGMEGAGFLSALAALRAGTGLSRYQYLSSIHTTYDPSVMVERYKEDNIQTFINRKTVCIVGPGLNAQDAKLVMEQIINKDLTLILDAGSLTALPKSLDFNNKCILTPHVGEAAKLLEVSNDYILTNPIEAALILNKQFRTPIVLKSASTVLAFDGEISLITNGHSSLATAGSGDVLAGVIGAYVARYGLTRHVIEQAIYKHASLSDISSSMIASDLIKGL